MDQPNKQILELFIKGDPKATDEIYRYYRIPIIRFAVSILKDEIEAENIFHEVFLKMISRRDKINPSMNFSSYIITAVKNEVFDYFNRVKKDQQLKEQFWNNIQKHSVDDQVEKEAHLEQLEKLVGQLSPKRKRVLEMNIFEKKSYQEIANELAISINTVKNQLIKAKALIRQEMDNSLSK
ncbi:RNA polymerase sigma-70 factor [Echinicola strongylocentroti]|uniref:RNA polymerase sigma-70 factor n=1 Tax=Echinicola strongylocentroti TaxID=1795355 RepID=A0A2Z4ID90_9BACT|nr:sigma-70 family RNA polymerase sigma factor [Echinicola strongylocentroti]AWW28780.1 RNA polymerase sigma-70 factor [Echinicola strongylocentroti]